MRLSCCRLLILVLGVTVASWGCSSKPYKGPQVDAFNGRLMHDGKSVSFPDDEKVTLRLFFHEKGGVMGVPIKPDGTFQIGWMPIGTYSSMLIREKGPSQDGRGGGQNVYSVPGEFKIEDGKTEYTIDLGPNWKP